MQRVVKVKTDIKQLVPTIDYIIENYGVVPKNILVDNGYVRQETSLFSIEFSENRDIFNPCCVGFPPLKLLIQ